MSDGSLIMIILILALVMIGACIGANQSSEKAVKVLNDSGYTEINCTNNHWLLPGIYGCESYTNSFDCSAINPVGNKVDTTVCTSWMFKGSSIKF